MLSMVAMRGDPLAPKVHLYLQCIYRRLTRILSAVALAEKGCFDEVRELRGDPPPGAAERPETRTAGSVARDTSTS